MPSAVSATAQEARLSIEPDRAAARSTKEGAVTRTTSRPQASRLFRRARCPASTRRPAMLDCTADKGLSPPRCRTMIGGDEAITPLRGGRTMAEFARRRIGRTALEVTVLGLGCATLGGSRIDVTREAAETIVSAAWASGVRYVDTAPYYGLGQAERCVGDALRAMPRDDWVLSTKVGRLLRPRGAAADPGERRRG